MNNRPTILALLGLLSLFGLAANAQDPETHRFPKTHVSLDFTTPYVLRSGGASLNRRDALQMGIGAHHLVSRNLAVGLRFSGDIEKEPISPARKLILWPGIRYLWNIGSRFVPIARFDVPWIARGAANLSGKKGQMDVGLEFGGGLRWNVGDAMGWQGFFMQYAFDIQYFFGLGNAANQFRLELLRFSIGRSF